MLNFATTAVTLTSTRRFSAWPSSVKFEAIGSRPPRQRTTSLGSAAFKILASSELVACARSRLSRRSLGGLCAPNGSMLALACPVTEIAVVCGWPPSSRFSRRASCVSVARAAGVRVGLL
jgi:hypothetical protein